MTLCHNAGLYGRAPTRYFDRHKRPIRYTVGKTSKRGSIMFKHCHSRSGFLLLGIAALFAAFALFTLFSAMGSMIMTALVGLAGIMACKPRQPTTEAPRHPVIHTPMARPTAQGLGNLKVMRMPIGKSPTSIGSWANKIFPTMWNPCGGRSSPFHNWN